MTWSVGCRTLKFTDDDLTFPGLVMYPTDAPEQSVTFGPYTVAAAPDAQVAAGRYPLVAISHGNGGSYLLHRTLAAHLARHGFIVVMLEHAGNSRTNNELANTAANLARRPRHLQLALDQVSDLFFEHLIPDTIAVIGHSIGGYTALALAGGRPSSSPHETDVEQPGPIDVPHDDRIKALVLLAPATPWFMLDGALKDVTVPILMLSGEKDEHTTLWHADIVRKGLPDAALLESHVIPNAGHFSFQSPFPPHLINPAFPPSQDPPGFDRVAYHESLNAEVLAFLRRVL